MKRFVAYGLTIALLAACSTQEIDFQTTTLDDEIFYASFEQPAEDGTRVYANEDLLLRWTADDRVSIFGKNTYNQQYKFLGETGDNSGGFNKVDDAEYVTGNPISHTVSVYPYQASTKISEDEVLTVTLPAEQHYAENTFGQGANTMVSVSEDNFLQYKNVGGFLRISLYGGGALVNSITLKGNNGEKLAGKATITMLVDGAPSLVMTNDATDEIRLVFETAIALGNIAEESKDFWFVVPPVEFKEGFSIVVSGPTCHLEKSTTKDLTIERNKLSKMSPIEVEASIDNNCIVYTSTDGSVINPKNLYAIGDSIISNEYKDGYGIITFDRDLISIWNSAFSRCYGLTSITIPDSVTSLGDWAFSDCTGLTSITIPDSVTNIGSSTFCRCTGLTSITIPDSVTSIGDYAFSNCFGLTSITIPNSVTSIGDSAFSNCIGLTSITIPDSVTSIGDRAFSDCTGLTSITIPDSVTSLGDWAFLLCTGLTSITIPNSVTNIGSGVFRSCTGLTSITIPDSVTSIGDYAFLECTGLTSITVLSETPPTGGYEMFNNTNSSPIYVPGGSVDAYKSALYWSDYADRIQAIPSSSVPIPEAVDLGLSVKWASFNLGASKPEEYGNYYAWGETEPKDDYSWSTYKWCEGTRTTLTKYCNDSSCGYNGFTDTKTVLDPEDDAAVANWGGKWRMPTDAEWTELRENCTWTETTQNGVSGLLVTGTKGKSVFLPAAGRRDGTGLLIVGSSGEYWSSSLRSDLPPDCAWYVLSPDNPRYVTDSNRCLGFSVRPVYAE